MPRSDVSGQLIFRDTGEKAGAPDGRRLMMVIGVLAVPETMFIESECQYVAVGSQIGEGALRLSILQHGVTDVTEKIRGCGAGGILTMPIWRV